MNIAIFGASGFLGTNLTYYLSERTDWPIHAYARNINKVRSLGKLSDRVSYEEVDVTDYNQLISALKNIDVAYYFVHMMGHSGPDFHEAEINAAKTFARAAKSSKLAKIIYMGGLGDDSTKLSLHLDGRHKTGAALLTSGATVIEFRASMIIGRGSVSFDILDNTVKKLPITPLPSFTETLTQPIALQNALEYLEAATDDQYNNNAIIEIGGPERISYFDLYKLYAKVIDKRRLVIKVPYMPLFLSTLGFNLLTPKIHARIATVMIDSMKNEMVADLSNATALFPSIILLPLEQALKTNTV